MFSLFKPRSPQSYASTPPDEKDPRSLLDAAHGSRARGDVAQAAAELLRAAALYEQQGFSHKAVALARQATQLQPTHASAWELLVGLFERGDRPQDLREALTSLARLYADQHRGDEARTVRDRLQALRPTR